MGSWVLSFAGLALVYAALTSMVLFLGARLFGKSPSWHLLPLVFTTLVFVFLTQHPFPDPTQLDCPVPTAEPQLQPFKFWDTVVRLHDRGASADDWLRNRTIAATVMNFLVCGIIGIALVRHTVRSSTALVFGTGLTLFVEVSQLTGLWGLYPCAYRQFNVDDLIMNILGVGAGFLFARALMTKLHIGKSHRG
jgi:hypothetical protein